MHKYDEALQEGMCCVVNGIFVKTSSGKTIALEVKCSDTIGNVKAMIQNKEGISPDEQVVIFNKMVPEDIDTLTYFYIKNESTLTLITKSKGDANICPDL
ncbi:40S ribosomal protein S27A [Artemisia annua]|uniref:40S ribosomal protein S27A n=1 Tax=Artemisia annua TaxID=35608 RepID=A0A2U1LSJ5_ARTAN|nr:40S ribosomal protein S27A [Artemisia annua]